VDNLPAFSAEVFFHDSAQHKTQASTRHRTARLQIFLISVHLQNSRPLFFLNCTKNIGLTPRSFARTFSSPSQKKELAATVIGETREQSAFMLGLTTNNSTSPRRDQRAMKTTHEKTMNEWITYRTRFLVKAKQLNYSLSFTDSLGRHHTGRKGDYLVESSDGVLSIAPRQIFEDVYVAISNSDESLSSLLLPPLLARKSPQSCRDRRSQSAGLRFS
jgi:hypothetical protein